MVLAWRKAKIRISDPPTIPPRLWPYLYGRKKGPCEESSMSQPLWPPTTLSPKTLNGKRPITRALEPTPPTVISTSSQSLPLAPIQESLPPLEMTMMDTPMDE